MEEQLDDPYRTRRPENAPSPRRNQSPPPPAAEPGPSYWQSTQSSSSPPPSSSSSSPNGPSPKQASGDRKDAQTEALESDDEVAEGDRDRYYALLNVERDATEEQIRDAYRALAIACHPDKHSGDAAKAAAQSRFQAIQKAYDVLSDRDKRNVYDYFGEDGLNSNWSISLRGRSPQELRAEYEKHKAMKRAEEAEGMVNSRGEYTAQVDATSLFAPSHLFRRREQDQDVETPVTLEERLALVRSGSLSGRHAFDTGITSTTGLKIAGEMVARGGNGSGALFATLKKVWGPRLLTETTLSLLGPSIAKMEATYQMNEFTFFNAQMAASTLSRPPTVALTFGQQLSAKSPIHGFVNFHSGSYTLGSWGKYSLTDLTQQMVQPFEPPLFTVGLTNAPIKGTGWTINTMWGLRDFGFGASRSMIAKWLGGAKLKTSINFGLMSGYKISTGAERAVTDTTKMSFGVALGVPTGVTVNFGWRRLGQSIKIPVVLARSPRADLAIFSTAVPLAGLFALETFYLGPANRRKVSNRLAELRRDNFDMIRQGRQGAKEGVRVLKGQARKKAAAERSKAGLIILDAHYGKEDVLPALSPVQDAEEMDRIAWGRSSAQEAGASEQSDAAEEIPQSYTDFELFWDVKIPVQALVSNSRLIIPGGRSKSNLLGFYNAAMGERKVLRIRYIFRGQVHEATFADKDAVAAPMRAHQV